MAQVIIVSNRLPISVSKENGELKFSASVGGVATGLSSYADDPRNHWVGWPGLASDGLTNQERHQIVQTLAEHNCTPIFLTKKQIDDFYNGYSNEVLWPLFHGLPLKQKSATKLSHWWQTYREVNKRFADIVAAHAEDDNQIWIHDYHLLLLPELLRSQGAGQNIGFFLHIPFPKVKAMSRLPEHKKLLRGMLGADLIGFHITGYVQDFLDNCQAAGLGTITDHQIQIDNHIVRAAEFPMGIDYTKFAEAGKLKPVQLAVKRYKRRYRWRKLIVSVDRLDPSKGLIERLEAYRQFLDFYPHRRGRVVFAMVVAPSRTDIGTYKSLSKRLDVLVEEINTAYGTPSWQPIDYMNEAQPFEEIAALFQLADVAFIAPLKDGMNLTAKEFVASNNRRGVLILSETAGAAQELSQALIVNPRKPQEVVDALQRALTMRRGELRRRLRMMRKDLSVNTVQDWAKNFIDALQQPVASSAYLTRSFTSRLQLSLVREWRSAKKRLLLLDYDGSLVPFTENYKAAVPPKPLIALLKKLGEDKRNDVVLVSGRQADDLGKWFSDLPLDIVAEHGAAIKKAGHKTWQTIEKADSDWRQLLLPALEKYARQTPGAMVEVKPHSIVWHYRAAMPYYAQKNTVVIKRALKPILKMYGLELMQGNKILEIKDPAISKGAIVQRWLKNPYDIVLAFGDDATDEEMFASLAPTAYSLKVGRGRTLARFRLRSYKNVLELLSKLSN